MLVLGVTVSAAAITSDILERDQVLWAGGSQDINRIGHSGYGVLARTFGVFGVALLVGAIVGRQLPSFVVAVLVGLGFLSLLTPARDLWFASHQPHVIGVEGEFGLIERIGPGISTGLMWRAADGTLITDGEASAAAQGASVEEWLRGHGYTRVAVGISPDTAAGWAPYEAVAFALVGGASLGIAALVIGRRRPEPG